MPIAWEARLRAAERAADHVAAERAARIARRPIASADEAVALIIAAEGEPDRDDRVRAIMGRLTGEARAALRVVLEEAIGPRRRARHRLPLSPRGPSSLSPRCAHVTAILAGINSTGLALRATPTPQGRRQDRVGMRSRRHGFTSRLIEALQASHGRKNWSPTTASSNASHSSASGSSMLRADLQATDRGAPSITMDAELARIPFRERAS